MHVGLMVNDISRKTGSYDVAMNCILLCIKNIIKIKAPTDPCTENKIPKHIENYLADDSTTEQLFKLFLYDNNYFVSYGTSAGVFLIEYFHSYC